MGKERTEKSRYQSRYSPDKYVTAAQYIIELVCEKKATFDKTVLPIKFWNLPQWAGFFKCNLRKVHQLLKKFDEKAIIRALNLPQFNNSYSIFTDRFMGLVEQEQGRLDQQSKIEVVQKDVNRNTINSKPRPQKKVDTLLTKLDEI